MLWEHLSVYLYENAGMMVNYTGFKWRCQYFLLVCIWNHYFDCCLCGKITEIHIIETKVIRNVQAHSFFLFFFFCLVFITKSVRTPYCYFAKQYWDWKTLLFFCLDSYLKVTWCHAKMTIQMAIIIYRLRSSWGHDICSSIFFYLEVKRQYKVFFLITCVHPWACTVFCMAASVAA